MPAKLNQTVAKTNNQSSLQCYPEILKKLYFFFDIVAKTKEEIMKKTEKNLKITQQPAMILFVFPFLNLLSVPVHHIPVTSKSI